MAFENVDSPVPETVEGTVPDVLSSRPSLPRHA